MLLHEVIISSFLLVVASLQKLHATLCILRLLKRAAAQTLQILCLLELTECVAEIILSLVGCARELLLLLLLKQVAQELRTILQKLVLQCLIQLILRVERGTKVV